MERTRDQLGAALIVIIARKSDGTTTLSLFENQNHPFLSLFPMYAQAAEREFFVGTLTECCGFRAG
jgi:hypothetical protein